MLEVNINKKEARFDIRNLKKSISKAEDNIEN